LALFDFDGTLTHRDTVLPFLLSVCGNQALPRFTVAAARGFAGDADARRDAAKAAIIMSALAGRASADVDAAGRAYARVVVNKALQPAGRALLEWHRAHGHRLAIVSASLEPYLNVVAELLGVELCLCTQLEVGADGRLTGAMAGANCRGAEKARRVRAVIEPDDYEVWAYGDTAGDAALLALADHPVWVGRGARRASS
jgi:phosphatidylglycerophosphatase C